jgi:hypothetical protein
MDASPSKGSGIELNDVRSTGREVPKVARSIDREDDLALARLGKKAVLKVGAIAAHRQLLIGCADDIQEAIWLPYNPGLHLHHSDHLGECFGVSHRLFKRHGAKLTQRKSVCNRILKVSSPLHRVSLPLTKTVVVLQAPSTAIFSHGLVMCLYTQSYQS